MRVNKETRKRPRCKRKEPQQRNTGKENKTSGRALYDPQEKMKQHGTDESSTGARKERGATEKGDEKATDTTNGTKKAEETKKQGH